MNIIVTVFTTALVQILESILEEVKTIKDEIKSINMKLERLLITNEVDAEVTKEQIVKRVDIMLIPTHNAYTFGLQLLDKFFTKDELGSCIAFQGTRSKKTLLNQEKLCQLIELIMQRRFPGTKGPPHPELSSRKRPENKATTSLVLTNAIIR